ncbi:SPOR domain-containing protein [Sphingobium sp. SYK-6]|uniref:SPOR domain-containing protein n=1 Tax=Sphingobium sp. (strain NBRC 103272 / SYK-6) TaxID=627192 RepID=UPI0011D234CC|nr:SPOR domain-containing protein [Sphingobium sp. SYK-6]
MTRTRWFMALMLATTAGAQAQTSGEVVQATPPAAAVEQLNRNLAQLSRNPQDVNALLGAGQAALDLGDIQAANGFYARANMVNPRLGKAKLGLAIVQIALKQPVEAAMNFDLAAELGEQAQGHLAERGLAYDLTGQQEKAQRDYAAALRANPGDQLARLRHAVSLGISGRVAESDSELEKQLSDGDREAWRMRAFIYAMNGRIGEARRVTQSVMPKGLAEALDPYMQRLPLLDAGQKAAAAYYGEFPANVLKLAAPDPVRERDVQVAAANAEREAARSSRRNRSSDRNAGRDSRQRTANAGQAAERPSASTPASAGWSNAPKAPAGQPPAPTTPTPTPAPAPAASAPASTQLASGAQTAPPSRATTPPPAPAPQTQGATAAPPRAQGPSDPGTAIAAATPSTPPSGPAPAPAPSAGAPSPGFSPSAQPVAAPAPSLADALSALSIPEEERRRAAAADLEAVARIQEQRRKAQAAADAKAKAEAEAKAKARAEAEAEKKAEAERKAKLAANPSRNWVQIATGKDVDALAFDLRRMRRTYADAIGDQAGWTAQWGATRRLLVGPFKNVEDARAVVAKIAKSGGDAFLWQSEAGEDVTKIGGK